MPQKAEPTQGCPYSTAPVPSRSRHAGRYLAEGFHIFALQTLGILNAFRGAVAGAVLGSGLGLFSARRHMQIYQHNLPNILLFATLCPPLRVRQRQCKLLRQLDDMTCFMLPRCAHSFGRRQLWRRPGTPAAV